jgi:hypothetical protein
VIRYSVATLRDRPLRRGKGHEITCCETLYRIVLAGHKTSVSLEGDDLRHRRISVSGINSVDVLVVVIVWFTDHIAQLFFCGADTTLEKVQPAQSPTFLSWLGAHLCQIADMPAVTRRDSLMNPAPPDYTPSGRGRRVKSTGFPESVEGIDALVDQAARETLSATLTQPPLRAAQTASGARVGQPRSRRRQVPPLIPVHFTNRSGR